MNYITSQIGGKNLHEKNIEELSTKDIDDFEDHPYKIREDNEMMNLVESVKENGVLLLC